MTRRPWAPARSPTRSSRSSGPTLPRPNARALRAGSRLRAVRPILPGGTSSLRNWRTPLQDIDLAALLRTLAEHDGSDLHLKVGSPPIIRVDGELHRLEGSRLTP